MIEACGSVERENVVVSKIPRLRMEENSSEVALYFFSHGNVKKIFRTI